MLFPELYEVKVNKAPFVGFGVGYHPDCLPLIRPCYEGMYQLERESFQEAYYRTFIFYAIIDNRIGGQSLRCYAAKRIKERFDEYGITWITLLL